MLRKRTRSHQKDKQMGNLTRSDSGSESQLQSDCMGHNQKTNSFYPVPGLFIGLSPKGLSDCDSVRSPTSPLDFRMFSTKGNPYGSPRSPHGGRQKSWDSTKVGLSIVDSLNDDKEGSSEVLRSSESKNILFGPGVRSKTPNFLAHTDSFEAPKSLPRNFAIFPRTLSKSPLQKDSSSGVLFEIGEGPFASEPFGKIRSCSLDSCRSFSTLSQSAGRSSKVSSRNFCVDNLSNQVNSPRITGSPNSNNFSSTNLTHTSMSVSSGTGFVASLSASEIELSEDYTCVISHGPNPKTTHIYGDCILECHSNDLSNFCKNEGKDIELPQAVAATAKIPSELRSNDFLSFCFYCNKKLDAGKDIYIYRGEKAFCSLNCRAEEIMIDEELEKSTNKSSEDVPESSYGNGIFENGIVDAP